MFGRTLRTFQATRGRKVWLAALVVTASTVVGAGAATAAEPRDTTPVAAAPQVFNVKNYGATGNGRSNDAPAVDRAIQAATKATGGGIVQFPSGTYRAAATRST